MNRTRALIAGTALAAAGLTAGGGVALAASHPKADPPGESRKEANYTDHHRADAKVTEQQAIDAATARHPGTPSDAHLQNEGDGLRWEVKSADGTTVWEIQVDANTGSIVGDQPDE